MPTASRTGILSGNQINISWVASHIAKPMNHHAMVTIRPAKPDDRDALERCFIELQAFERRIEPNRVDGESIAATYVDELFKICETSEGKIFVAEYGGVVAGFVCVLARTDSGEIIERWRERGYITDIVVLNGYRRRGIGQALIKAAEDYAVARGAHTLMIGVLVSNEPARGLYRAVGFRETELILKKQIG